MIARLARVALAFALLAGWQAALLHPLEHVDSHGALVHAGQDHQKTPGELCDQLNALTACAPAAAVALAVAEVFQEFPLQRSGAPRVAEALPFLSQGPPTLL